MAESAENPESWPAIIIGGGPAGLMAADVLAEAGVRVLVCDAMPSLARKLLRAGVGGLNLTHAESKQLFLTRYGGSLDVAGWLTQFDADSVRHWAHSLGIATRVGSSDRVFPVQHKASPLLRAWLQRLQTLGVEFRTRHRWMDWRHSADGFVHTFSTPDGTCEIRSRVTVLALGGGSWARLGSDGKWLAVLQQHGVCCAALTPSNCGFNYSWTDSFRQRFAGQPLKNVALSVESGTTEGAWRKGEAVISRYGIEGGLVYALSAQIRGELDGSHRAQLIWDLLPDRTAAAVQQALAQPRGKMSVSNFLRKKLGLSPLKIALLRELLPEQMADLTTLAGRVKNLPMTVKSLRPLDEAISTAGGVMASELDPTLMLVQQPGLFCAGEMLDWDAPTGGYLLTAVLASGQLAGTGARDFLARLSN